MKIVANITPSFQKYQEAKVVHFITTNQGYKAIDPVPSTEMVCPFCGGHQHFTWWVAQEKKYAWMCGLVCSLSVLPKCDTPDIVKAPPVRSIPWALWCEINRVGDVHHDVSFERINQVAEKLKFLDGFSKNPSGIVVMRGEAGAGKTFAALGLCEKFTRTSTRCEFFTQNTMMRLWLESFKEDVPSHFGDKLKNIDLLVIDDFGTYEPAAGFMAFFMDLIDYRMQWMKKGTVITTNLSSEMMNEYCGHNLSDRIGTGQLMTFSHSSRRKTQPQTQTQTQAKP